MGRIPGAISDCYFSPCPYSTGGIDDYGAYFFSSRTVSSLFRKTKNMFDKLAKLKLERVNMRYLSMGMSNSYRVAIEEGANMVRIGSAIFGPRGRP